MWSQGAEGDLQQLVPDCFGIGNAVLLAAQLYPVEVGIDGVDVMRLVVHLLVGLEGVSPGGRGELHGWSVSRAWDEQAHAHGLAVCLGKAELLAELGPASRPTRNSAPVKGARMLSPEQSMKISALTVCQV